MAGESLDFVKEVVRKVWDKFIEHFDAAANVDSLFSRKLIDESTMHVILAAKATKDANRAFLLYLLSHATTDSLKTLCKLLCDTSGTCQRHGSLARSLEGPLKLGKVPLSSPVAVRRVANGGSRSSSPQSSISEHTHTVISEGDQTSRLGAVAALDLHIYKDPYQLSPQSSYSEDYLNEDKIDQRVQDSFLCVLARVAKILNKFFNDLKTVLQRYLKDERRPFDQLDPEYIDSAADIQAIFRKIQIEDFWLNTSPLIRLINVVCDKASRERAMKLLDKYHEDLKSLSTVVLLKHIPKHDISDYRLERWRSSVEHLAVTFDLEFENFKLSDLFAQQEFLSRIFKIPPSAFSYLSSGPTGSTVVRWALHISASQAFEILERAQCAFWRLKEHLIIKVEVEGMFQFHLRGKHLPHLIKKALHRNQEFLTFTEHISHQFLALVDYSHLKRRDFHQRGGYQPIGVDPETVGSDVHETESRTPIGSTLSEQYADVRMDQESNPASTKMTKLGTFWSRTVTSPLSKLFARFAEVIRQPPQPVHDNGPGGGPTEEEHSDPAPVKMMRPVTHSKDSVSSRVPSSSDGPTPTGSSTGVYLDVTVANVSSPSAKKGGPKGFLSGVASGPSPSLPSKIPAVEGVHAEPTASELWKHAGQHMHSEWYKFGVVLQVSENILKSIKQENLLSSKDCFISLSQQWLRRGNGTGEALRTWRTVLEALKECGFPDLAKEVKKLIHQGKLNEPEPSGSDYRQPPSDVLRPLSALEVAEIDISASPVPSQPGAADDTRTASHSKVLLPAGKRYDFQHSGQDRKIRVYTDILPPRRDASHKDISEVPKLIDKLVPVTLMILMDFVPDLAAVWDKVGIKLDLQNKVDMLFKQQGDVCTNLTAIFSVWIRKGKNVSWSYLLQQLESPGVDKNNVANDIRDYLCRQVPEVPDNIDFLYPVTIESLMPLVAPCTEHWECIAEALMLQKLVDQLQKDDTIDGPYVKTAAIFHHWINAYGDEASWVNILASFGARPELLPLVPGIKQHLMQQVYEMYKAVPDRIRS